MCGCQRKVHGITFIIQLVRLYGRVFLLQLERFMTKDYLWYNRNIIALRQKEGKLLVYQAFYRVYRPQSFAEMSGQQHVKQTLQNALLHNKTTHAYLFSGPRGTGKTSAAKIFAKALNCENGPAKEPCNECPTCLSITEGSNTDVIEFDAASNSRVEEMRDIIEKVRFAPSNARFKVYIIDEVHMLSNSAFNAF